MTIGLNELAVFDAANSLTQVSEAPGPGLTRLNIKLTPSETMARSLEDSRKDLVVEILECVRSVKPELFDSVPDIARNVFAEIGSLDPALSRELIKRVGFGNELSSYVLPDLVKLLLFETLRCHPKHQRGASYQGPLGWPSLHPTNKLGPPILVTDNRTRWLS